MDGQNTKSSRLITKPIPVTWRADSILGRPRIRTAAVLAVVVVASGCSIGPIGTVAAGSEPAVIAEGTLLTICFDDGQGRPVAMTRHDSAESLPTENGLWNVDAQVRVTTEFVTIERGSIGTGKPVRRVLIPKSRVFWVTLGDGGRPVVTGGEGRRSTGKTDWIGAF